MRHIGEGWTGEEAVALALYCVMRHPTLRRRRARGYSNGDRRFDRLHAGGMMGARLGIEAITAACRRAAKTEALLLLAERLAAKRATWGWA
jgi:ADP-ribosylglycohydrolase